MSCTVHPGSVTRGRTRSTGGAPATSLPLASFTVSWYNSISSVISETRNGLILARTVWTATPPQVSGNGVKAVPVSYQSCRTSSGRPSRPYSVHLPQPRQCMLRTISARRRARRCALSRTPFGRQTEGERQRRVRACNKTAKRYVVQVGRYARSRAEHCDLLLCTVSTERAGGANRLGIHLGHEQPLAVLERAILHSVRCLLAGS
jgi:hypothetical protein